MDADARPSQTDRYQVGDLLIDAQRQTVSRNGVELPLPRLSYELLLALLRAHPRMLSNDELLTSVWAPAVVNPETVSQRIKLLRNALGDDPQSPRYIESIRGRGYRLTAHVSPPSPQATPPGRDPAATAPRRAGRLRRPALMLGGTIAVMAAAGVAFWHWHHSFEQPTPMTAAAALAVTGAAPPERSIAVLPFLDLSEDKEEGYFADGMTEEVTSLLSQVGDLRVSARTSAFYFRDRSAQIGEIGRTLGVANVLEGSVRKSGNLVRVTAQLIRTDTGYHLWSASYDRRPDDLFVTQTEIARAVVDHLKASLLGEPAFYGVLSADAAARTLYLQSMEEFNRGTRAGLHQALENLRRAVAKDPNFAQAWAVLSRVYIYTIFFDGASVASVRSLALDATNRALKINPSLSEAHAAKAGLLWVLDWNIAEALPEIRRALDADPNNIGVLQMAAKLQMMCGHPDEAVRLAREVVGRDPLVALNYEELAEALWGAGQLPEAMHAAQTALALNPGTRYGRFRLALLQLTAGDATAAWAGVDQGNDAQARQLLRPFMLDALGRHADAEREQAIAEQNYGPAAAGDLAVYYAYRGNVDKALPWLERAFQNHDLSMLEIKGSPRFAKLRPDPRFQALLRRHRIPDETLCQ
jgi:TolB-like protein/DNA-binding winged helix-turn-helix (wHTH) protein/Tfp pilus assembly protein PilF